MQSFQLEGENDTETSDNKKSDGQHIEHGNSTKSRLPDDSHRAKDSQNAKHQIPPPVLCAIAFQICGIATQCKPSEHQPESNNKRNQFHADQRIEYQIMASSVTDTPLFTHIRYLMITTVPSLVITLIIFTIAGLSHEATDTGHIAEYTRILSDKFHISWWLMIVPVVTAILIARKVPSIITLFVSTALATVFALIFQPGLLCEIAGQGVEGIAALFKGGMGMLYGGTQLETGNAEINELISTRGMAGMMNTIWLIICAMCFGGAMTAGGMLGSITSVFVRFTKKRVGMVSSTVASGLFLNLATADQYISIILTGNMFKDIYSANGYESKLLSRTTEDSVTVTSPLIPWNTCGMTQATILSVPTIVYLPYAFFNIISPLMSITIAILGYKIKKKAEQPGLS